MTTITKETIRKIKAGSHDDLMEAIEYLLDIYNDDKLSEGYKCCLADMSVRAQRLAEHIWEKVQKTGKIEHHKKDTYYLFNSAAELAQIIEKYFNEALKNE